MAYCSTDDLLIGDIVLGATDPQKFVNGASLEMDSKLGQYYVVPFNRAVVPDWAWQTLVRINAQLASGRLILALDSAGEDSSQHAYGVALVKEAQTDIEGIRRGVITIPGAPLNPAAVGAGNGPSVLTADRESGVDVFYDYVTNPPIVTPPLNPYGSYWRPGIRGGWGSQYGSIGPSSTPEVRTPGYVDPVADEVVGEEGGEEGTP